MEKGKRKGISPLTRSGGISAQLGPPAGDGAVGVGPRASEEGERR
jgi:hypothetical protein